MRCPGSQWSNRFHRIIHIFALPLPAPSQTFLPHLHFKTQRAISVLYDCLNYKCLLQVFLLEVRMPASRKVCSRVTPAYCVYSTKVLMAIGFNQRPCLHSRDIHVTDSTRPSAVTNTTHHPTGIYKAICTSDWFG